MKQTRYEPPHPLWLSPEQAVRRLRRATELAPLEQRLLRRALADRISSALKERNGSALRWWEYHWYRTLEGRPRLTVCEADMLANELAREAARVGDRHIWAAARAWRTKALRRASQNPSLELENPSATLGSGDADGGRS